MKHIWLFLTAILCFSSPQNVLAQKGFSLHASSDSITVLPMNQLTFIIDLKGTTTEATLGELQKLNGAGLEYQFVRTMKKKGKNRKNAFLTGLKTTIFVGLVDTGFRIIQRDVLGLPPVGIPFLRISF